MAEFHETGKKGEQIAAKHLADKGYQILEQNWRSGPNEIDIVAQKDNILVIAEVKTRRTNYFGEPEEFVTKSKQKLLIKAANDYITKNDLDHEVRFDIVSILYKKSQLAVHHIEDAFYPAIN